MISVTNEDEATVRAFVKKNKMTFPIGIDHRTRTMTAYAIQSIPAAFLIDPAGKVVWKGHTMALTKQMIEDALRPLKGSRIHGETPRFRLRLMGLLHWPSHRPPAKPEAWKP